MSELEIQNKVPMSSNQLEIMMRNGYAVYAMLNKTIALIQDDDEDDGTEYEFSVKEDLDIFRNLARILNIQCYGKADIKKISESDNLWKSIEVKSDSNKAINIKIRELNSSVDFKTDKFGYPDALEVFFFLRENHIYPANGRIISLLLKSSKIKAGLNEAVLDWNRILKEVDSSLIQYIDFRPLELKPQKLTIKLRDACIFLPAKGEEISSSNLLKLIEKQLRIRSKYSSIGIELENT